MEEKTIDSSIYVLMYREAAGEKLSVIKENKVSEDLYLNFYRNTGCLCTESSFIATNQVVKGLMVSLCYFL